MEGYPLSKIPKPCYIFDIDGTLADLTHRRHHVENKPKNWPAFHAGVHLDTPIEHICAVARALHATTAHHIVYCSGRMESSRMATVAWMNDVAKLPWGPIYMRSENDFRADDLVKVELLRAIKRDGYVPIMAFDDRDRVVKMWREQGIPCAQVAPGDF